MKTCADHAVTRKVLLKEKLQFNGVFSFRVLGFDAYHVYVGSMYFFPWKRGCILARCSKTFSSLGHVFGHGVLA